jgi:hypothetical protein
MAKIEKEIPNPGVGGSYLYDPKTGKLTLTTTTPALQNNGSDSEESFCSQRLSLPTGQTHLLLLAPMPFR